MNGWFLPLGLTNVWAPLSKKLMNSIFQCYIGRDFYWSILKNLLLFSINIELHYNGIHKTLETIVLKNYLKAKGSKCEFSIT